MDWSWFNELPEAIKYCVPLLVVGGIVAAWLLIVAVSTEIRWRPTAYQAWNALAVVGVLVGVWMLGASLEAPNYVYEMLGWAFICLFAGGGVLYNFVAWLRWANDW